MRVPVVDRGTAFSPMGYGGSVNVGFCVCSFSAEALPFPAPPADREPRLFPFTPAMTEPQTYDAHFCLPPTRSDFSSAEVSGRVLAAEGDGEELGEPCHTHQSRRFPKAGAHDGGGVQPTSGAMVNMPPESCSDLIRRLKAGAAWNRIGPRHHLAGTAASFNSTPFLRSSAAPS